MTPPAAPHQGRAAGYTICTLPGDGIGAEVVGCAVAVLEALGSRGGPAFRFDEQPAGAGAHERFGTALPGATLEAARAADAVLVGAMDAARLPAGSTQPLRALRRAFEVAASVRPARTLPGVPAPLGRIDTVVVREVTEGLYSGIEYRTGADAACAVRLVTREASTRTARLAFELARQRRRKVTALHKIGGLGVTDGLFLESVGAVAEGYPDVAYQTANVDACALELVRGEHDFDVIVATNSFGDIISDLTAGLAGGLGLAPSGCVGPRWAYFEPVHGTAPDIAGKGVANPVATILSAALMLRHLGETAAAGTVEAAVATVLGRGGPRTPDLGGTATSAEVTEAVVGALDEAPEPMANTS